MPTRYEAFHARSCSTFFCETMPRSMTHTRRSWPYLARIGLPVMAAPFSHTRWTMNYSIEFDAGASWRGVCASCGRALDAWHGAVVAMDVAASCDACAHKKAPKLHAVAVLAREIMGHPELADAVKILREEAK